MVFGAGDSESIGGKIGADEHVTHRIARGDDAKRRLVDLADGGQRHLGEYGHMFRMRGRLRDKRCHKGADDFGIDALAGFQHHEGDRQFARIRIGLADRGCDCDRRMLEESVFDEAVLRSRV